MDEEEGGSSFFGERKKSKGSEGKEENGLIKSNKTSEENE